MAGTTFRDVAVSLFVAGAVFGQIWIDCPSATCCNFQYKNDRQHTFTYSSVLALFFWVVQRAICSTEYLCVVRN